ncbi:hypothetical protein ABZ815_12930 [Nonomuraea sp. NPDC047529]|uniref:hypothetical protein n=1 Tax=Nonomuraea sp. NPDC047529 TaxID=3155623 RepID=UPI0033D82D85
MLAWLTASRLLALGATWIAPATAVIMVHATVYRTLTNGLRRVAAVGAGVILVGGIGHLLGLGVLSLVLVVPPALAAASQERYLLAYVLATAIGALSGALVNSVLWPPLYRDRPGAAVRRLARETAALLTSVAEGLRDEWNLSALPDWERQAVRLDERLADAAAAVADGAESRRYNLRHSLHPAAAAQDHDQVLRRLTTLAAHAHTIVHALSHLEHHDGPSTDVSPDYARDYADLLDLLGDALTATVRRDPDPSRARTLLGRAEAQAGRIHEQMTTEIQKGEVVHPAGWALSGSLLTDAERILAILTSVLADTPGKPPAAPHPTPDHRRPPGIGLPRASVAGHTREPCSSGRSPSRTSPWSCWPRCATCNGRPGPATPSPRPTAGAPPTTRPSPPGP